MSEQPATPPPSCDLTCFRVLRVAPDGQVTTGGVSLLDQPGGFCWLDLTRQSERELAFLGHRFSFHHLALEDCAHLDQRPKVEEYDSHLFLVQHAFTSGEKPYDLEIHELHAFLGKEYLVTVHADAMPTVDEVFARAAKEPAIARRGPDFLLYLMSDRISEGHFALLDALADEIEGLEDAILTRLSRKNIESIFALKRALVTLRKTVSPARDVMGILSKRGDPRIGEKTSLYFRDVYDHLVRVTEAIEADRDLLGNALDAYLSMAANRTNDIMKQLTLVSVTFMPLTFITGFFGMNFTEIIPYQSHALFFGMLGTCLLLPPAMLWLFLRKQWV